MLKEQRHDIILSELDHKNLITIDELVFLTKSSKSTVHRDIDDLVTRHLLYRVRGGVMKSNPVLNAVDTNNKSEPPFHIRQDMYLEEKQRIAAAAHQYVKPNETLFLDSGTTVHEFSKTLYDIKPLYIATNDLNSAITLAAFTNIELNVLGGSVRQTHYSLNGYFTEYMISQMHADTAFIGIDAIDFNIGCMNFSTSEVQTKRLMMKHSHMNIVLCDHSKFESVAFVNMCKLTDIDLLITGSEVNPDYTDQLKHLGVNVLTV
ncbi:MAG: DeoR/GlpR family DNA-binding transcription regulator [Clostridiales bacterium]|nr:DeoR/GlpR family DNA-binding transcription regulator [Clostridiales bacterium]